MVASEHPKVIGGGIWLVSMDVLDPEGSYTDGAIQYYGTSFDEEYNSGLGDAGVRPGVTELVTKQVEEV